ADRNRSHWSTSKTPSYTKSVSWQHHHARYAINNTYINKTTGVLYARCNIKHM
ncbi:transposase, partial [Escherichia coli]